MSVSAGAAPGLASGSPITYSWTASAGVFAAPGAASTIYQCPRSDIAQAQTITLSASRGPCTVTQQATVICFGGDQGNGSTGEGGVGWLGGESLGGATGSDGGGTGGADGAAAAPDGGDDSAGPGGCGIDPTIDEGKTCNDCTNLNCTTLESAKNGVPLDGCHHLASDAQRQTCQALYCCMRSARCVHDGDPIACWCGSADPANCATGAAIANGPCVREVQAAAGTTTPSQIFVRVSDPTFPLGGAFNLATCRSNYCATPPSPECMGF